MVSEDDTVSNTEQVFVFIPQSGLNYIEQLQKLASKQCPNDKTPFTIGVNDVDKKVLLSKASCKMWNCEACGARLARQWIARIILGCNTGDEKWSFLTITAHRNARKAKSIPNIRQGWKKLYNRILSEVGKTSSKLRYAKVWEQHKEGSFHLHILLNVFLGTRWAKDSASECGLGYQCEWHEVENAGQVAGYISKYTLKNATVERGGVSIPKGLRRIEVSRNWPKLPPMDNNSLWSWKIAENLQFQSEIAGFFQTQGYEVLDLLQK